MNVLITGVAGHIGSKLAEYIGRMPDARIIGVDDLSSGYRENVPVCVDFREYDLTIDCDLCAPAFDYIFHCAAYAAECMSPFVRVHNARSNIIATANVLNYALKTGCRRFVYLSSVAAYGYPRDEDGILCAPPFHESYQCIPHDPYGAAKLFCETDLRIAGEQHGLDWCVLRPHNVYGPGQSIWQRHRNVFGLWMRALLEDKSLTVFGDGGQRRAFSYIDDVVSCIWRAATTSEASRTVINLGGREPIRIKDALNSFAIATETYGKALVRTELARHEVRDAWCTTDRSERILGYLEETSLEDGLQAMWSWAKKSWEKFPERRERPPEFKLELEKGLPEAWRADFGLDCATEH